jgi:hypothetical protein
MEVKLFKKRRKMDLFRVYFSLKYMNKEKYASKVGGFVSLIFCRILLLVFVFNIIPFIKTKKFNLKDYIVNTQETESINLKDSPTAFAIGFDCPVDNRNNIEAKDLFDLKVSFITYIKDELGNRTKTGKDIKTHKCNPNDFHNEYKDSFNLLKIDEIYCLDEKEEKLEGIYADKNLHIMNSPLWQKKTQLNIIKKLMII